VIVPQRTDMMTVCSIVCYREHPRKADSHRHNSLLTIAQGGLWVAAAALGC
jgi:hypothetical protein